MDTSTSVEELIAERYGEKTTTKKDIGDFYLSEDHAVNIKSNNLDKDNYSPNLVSIKRMHEWVFEERKTLSFIFVDYRIKENGDMNIEKETEPIPIEHISWDCLKIRAQGYGVIQKEKDLIIDDQQTKSDFYQGFLKEYAQYLERERKKHEKFSRKFLDPKTINW